MSDDERMNKLYPCGDCAEEQGDEGLRPGTEFYWVKAARYAGGYRRSAYCKRHTAIRNNKSRAKANAEDTTGRLKQAKRQADRRFVQRHRAEHASASARYRKRHPEKVAERYRAWVERNPEKRRESQRAWAGRQRLRSAAPPIRRRKRKDDE